MRPGGRIVFAEVRGRDAGATAGLGPTVTAKMRCLIVLLRDLGLDFAFGEAGGDFFAYFDSA